MIRKFLPITVLCLLFAATSQQALAHVAYINMLTAPNTTLTANADGSTTYQRDWVVTSNGAWANGTDANWADSHTVPWHLINITDPAGAYINLSISGGITSIPSNPGLTPLGDLTPAFSLYSGTVPGAAHEGAAALPVPPGKEGAWNALGNTTMANDAGQIKTITYLTHVGDVNGTATSVSLNNYYLAAGQYTVVLGGTCYECYPHYDRLDPNSPTFDPNYENFIIDIENDAFQARGYRSVLTILPASVPVPAAIWLMGSGLLGLFGMRRTRKS
ncbi:MAG: VPLPA-CTERM sorting domain-containing protein [Methylococcaceae bacterium]|nr:VPLPA-CTERM sorting domain-containing protein [Methylococcaceae bacterium]